MQLHNHFNDKDWEILRARAERATRLLQTGREDANLSTLCVTIGSEFYAMPIETVLAVYEEVSVIPVPCTPPHVAGISNIRGRVLPVVDLAVLLGVASMTDAPKSALVVTAKGDATLAFRVDHIGAVQALAIKGLAPLTANLDLAHMPYLKGMLSDGSILLDIEAILSDPALIVNDLSSDA